MSGNNRIFATNPDLFGYAVDIIITRGDEILLIERGHDPYAGQWALPGGRIDFKDFKNGVDMVGDNEPSGKEFMTLVAKIAAMREVGEEVSIALDPTSEHDSSKLKHVMTAMRDRDVDPRCATQTFVHHIELPHGIAVRAGDDAKTYFWFLLSDLPPMAFDHEDIIGKFLANKK